MDYSFKQELEKKRIHPAESESDGFSNADAMPENLPQKINEPFTNQYLFGQSNQEMNDFRYQNKSSIGNNYCNNSNDFEFIEEDIYNDFAREIDEILENKASEEEKNEIIDHLWYILQMEEKKMIRQQNLFEKSQNIPNYPPFFGQCHKSINLCLLTYPTQPPQLPNSYPYPIYNYQPYVIPVNYYMSMQQPYQPPFNMPNYSSIPPQIPKQKDTKSNHKKKSKKEHKKESKKSKSSNKKGSHHSSKPTIVKEYTDSPFSGIFNELTKKCQNRNILEEGVINITGNKHPMASPYKTIVDFNYTGSSYGSENQPNSFICFDFKGKMVALSAYTIKSSNQMSPDFIKSWVVEGSDDKVKWTQIGSHENDSSLCSRSKVCVFKIEEKKKRKMKFKFIQIRMTGKSDRGNDYFDLTNVELFGEYYEN